MGRRCSMNSTRKHSQTPSDRTKGAAFAAKDALRLRGYRWNAGHKVWWRDVLDGPAGFSCGCKYCNKCSDDHGAKRGVVISLYSINACDVANVTSR